MEESSHVCPCWTNCSSKTPRAGQGALEFSSFQCSLKEIGFFGGAAWPGFIRSSDTQESLWGYLLSEEWQCCHATNCQG